MLFKIKENTAEGGYSLHTKYGYAYCPFDNSPRRRACGTWCALFRYLRGGKALQTCADATIYLDKEKNEKTS